MDAADLWGCWSCDAFGNSWMEDELLYFGADGIGLSCYLRRAVGLSP